MVVRESMRAMKEGQKEGERGRKGGVVFNRG